MKDHDIYYKIEKAHQLSSLFAASQNINSLWNICKTFFKTALYKFIVWHWKKELNINGRISVIYWFAYYNLDSPSVRYRAKYPLDFFRDEYGIDSFLSIPGYSAKRIFQFLRAYIFLFCSEKRILW